MWDTDLKLSVQSILQYIFSSGFGKHTHHIFWHYLAHSFPIHSFSTPHHKVFWGFPMFAGEEKRLHWNKWVKMDIPQTRMDFLDWLFNTDNFMQSRDTKDL